jgi:hypothetical protein
MPDTPGGRPRKRVGFSFFRLDTSIWRPECVLMSKKHVKPPRTSKSSKSTSSLPARTKGAAITGGAERVRVQLALSPALWAGCKARAASLGYPHTPTSVIANLVAAAVDREFKAEA